MSDADALLEAIWANPRDDLPRLVLADWFDEHDEPECAAFIRAQCGYGQDPSEKLGNLERTARAEAAWNEYKARMVPVFPGIDFSFINYDRGLPTTSNEFIITASVLLNESETWWPRLPIRRIQLRGWVPVSRDIARCPYLSRLKVLYLDDRSITITAARHLADSPYLDRLQTLIVPFNADAGAVALLREQLGDVVTGQA